MFYSAWPLCFVLLRYWNGLSIRIESTWWANLIVTSGEWKPSPHCGLTRTHTKIGQGGQWVREGALLSRWRSQISGKGGGGRGSNVRAIFQGFHNGNLPLACLLSCAHTAEGQERWRGEEIRAGEAEDGQPARIHLSVASVKQTLSEKSQVMWTDDCQSSTLIEGFSVFLVAELLRWKIRFVFVFRRRGRKYDVPVRKVASGGSPGRGPHGTWAPSHG